MLQRSYSITLIKRTRVAKSRAEAILSPFRHFAINFILARSTCAANPIRKYALLIGNKTNAHRDLRPDEGPVSN